MKNYTLFICLLVFLSSCENWFDVEPRTEVKEENLFKDENGYFDALVGVYMIMGKPDLYGDMLTMSLQEGIVQNYYVTNSAHPLYYIQKMEYENTRVRPSIDAIWNGLYNAIANDNNIITHLNNVDKNIFSGENYNIIKGEALALRAYLHFDILRMFGPSFKMDKNKKCMPYVETVSKENTPYSTPEEIVKKCIKDLEEALILLENDPITGKTSDYGNIYLMNRNTRMNIYAVQATLARIYHYAGNKTEALNYAQQFIDHEKLSLTTNLTGVSTDRLFSQELIFALFVDNIASWADDHFGSSNLGYDYYQYGYTLDMVFDKNAGLGLDIRYSTLFNENASMYKLNKYLYNTGDSYNAKYRIPMLRLSEMYYIAAESTSNLDDATIWLNDVRSARGLESKDFTSFNEIEEYLTAEYRREFYGEGQLFYRYKMLDADEIKVGYTTINLEGKKEEAYIFPLPEQEEQFGGTTK